MDEKVKSYLIKKHIEINEKNQAKKEKTLISLGLYEKEYSPNNYSSAEFPHCERDKVEKKDKFYKKVAIAVTDEEYEEILKVSEKQEKLNQSTNGVATAMAVMAWIIFIAGFILGIVMGNVEVTTGYYYTHTETEFSFAIAMIYWSAALVSGLFTLSMAEIIKLLHSIARIF